MERIPELSGIIEHMDLIATLPAFVVAVMLISASPGPAMALIFRRAALRGFASTVPTVLGLELGIYLWALTAGAGLAALVAASNAAYLALRVLGAAFLILLGVRAWMAAWRDHAEQSEPATDVDAPRSRGWWVFGEGLIVQIANPKAAIFMFAFYPQFIPAGRPLLATTAVLALIQITLESCLYLTLAGCVGRAGAWFRLPRIRRRLEVVTGTVLVGLGLRVAVSHR